MLKDVDPTMACAGLRARSSCRKAASCSSSGEAPSIALDIGARSHNIDHLVITITDVYV